MRPIRTLLATGLGLVLALGTMATPVAAASTKVHVVNGYPGTKLAVCVDGKRVAKAMPYGRKVTKWSPAAGARVKVLRRGRNTARCRGRFVGAATVTSGTSTVVVTKHDPKRILVFNDPFITSQTTGTQMFHASDLGLVSFDFARSQLFPAATVVNKGSWLGMTTDAPVVEPYLHAARVRTYPGGQPLTSARVFLEVPGQIRLFVFVGTKPGNARLLTFQH